MTSEKYGGIMKTTDGGQTWTLSEVDGGFYSAGRAIKFIDAQTGWIALRSDSNPGDWNSGETV